MMDKKKEIPKGYSFRHGCFWCKQPLLTMKEKILRSCNVCAKDTLGSFNKMADGKIKEGLTEIKDKVFGTSKESNEEKIMKFALKKKRSKIEKKLRKKGLTEEQIKEGLDIFDKGLK